MSGWFNHFKPGLRPLKITYWWFVALIVTYMLVSMLPIFFQPLTLQYQVEFNSPSGQDWNRKGLEEQLQQLDESIKVVAVEGESSNEPEYSVTWYRTVQRGQVDSNPLDRQVRAALADHNLESNRGLIVSSESSFGLAREDRSISLVIWIPFVVILLAFFHWQQGYRKTIRGPSNSGVSFREIALSMTIGVLLVPVLGFLFGLAGADSDYRHPSPPDFTMQHLAAYLALILVIPLAEEIIFRGWLLERLSQVLRPGIALLISAAAFSAIHPMGLMLNLTFLVPGLVFGYLWLRHRSLLVCAVAHSSYNAGVLLLANW